MVNGGAWPALLVIVTGLHIAAAKTQELVIIAGAGKCGTNALALHLSAIAGFQATRRSTHAQKALNGFQGDMDGPEC